MASNPDFVRHVVDQLSGAGEARSRPMFGEYCVYLNDKVLGLICNNTLFMKQTEAGREFLVQPVLGEPYPGAKKAFVIDDRIEDADWLCELARLTEAELPRPKPKK